jgi:hypothetical protein
MCSFTRRPASVLRSQPCQGGLAIEESSIAHILAVTLDEVEGIEDCGARSLHAAQLFRQA